MKQKAFAKTSLTDANKVSGERGWGAGNRLILEAQIGSLKFTEGPANMSNQEAL